MVWLYWLGGFFLWLLLLLVLPRWQSLSRLKEAERRGWLTLLEWREFHALANNGQGCLIISRNGHTTYVWHPKSELTEDELFAAVVDDPTVKKEEPIKVVVPPFWCFGSRTLLQWMFPSIPVYALRLGAFR